MPGLQLVQCGVRDDPAAALVAEAEAELCTRYGVPSIGRLRPGDFDPDAGGAFVVAQIGDLSVGCGGIRRLDPETCELKRLYVSPAGRRRGVARTVLRHLQDLAAGAGYRRLWLETGTEQPEAIELYRSAGYAEIGPFGPHGHDHRSRYFGLDLARGDLDTTSGAGSGSRPAPTAAPADEEGGRVG